MRKTFITKMPDTPGAFLKAGQVISGADVNITRVSYNKAVDTHTLFIDVAGTEEKVKAISDELARFGYLSNEIGEAKVILIEFQLPDTPGALLPILETINRYDFNISYISSQENGTDYQFFKMGLFIEHPGDIKNFLEDAAGLCKVRIIDYDKSEKTLDNTVFYISFANEIANKLHLGRKDTLDLIADSNLIMQMLDEKNESPYKTFEYIGKYADKLAKHKGNMFQPRISHREIGDNVTLHLIEPPCGSNVYILEEGNSLLFVDSGFACYREEMNQIFHSLFPAFDTMQKEIVITHVDTDHCGLLDLFERVYLSRNSYENFVLENNGEDNFREQNPAHAPFCRIGRILSGYTPPSPDKLTVIDEEEPDDTKALSRIGNLEFFGLRFGVYEGNGGHVHGEIILVCSEHHLIFTGDVFVNARGFSPEQAEFNVLAPYLMTSVNMDSKKARQTREAVFNQMEEGEWIVCGGHGEITGYCKKNDA
ncbi:MAG: hypothetical protein PHT86_04200 [Methanocorpusculum sp.]|nr:hypothetical protein [Methanocorpusculum sp.]